MQACNPESNKPSPLCVFSSQTHLIVSHFLAVMQPQTAAGPLALPGSKRLPPRPGYGREGRPITLRANLFPVQLPQGILYHYDIDITPNCPKKINRIMFEALLKNECFGNQKPVFDGKKNMYCHSQLPIPDGTVSG